MATAAAGLEAIGDFLAQYINGTDHNLSAGAQILFLVGAVFATEYPEMAAQLVGVIGPEWTAQLRGTIDTIAGDLKAADM